MFGLHLFTFIDVLLQLHGVDGIALEFSDILPELRSVRDVAAEFLSMSGKLEDQSYVGLYKPAPFSWT